jgi:competence protein ComEC
MEKLFDTLKSHRHLNIFVFIWSFIFGILVSSIIKISPIYSVLILIIVLGIYICEKLINNSVSKVVFIILLSFSAFGLGVLRFGIKDFHIPNSNFEQNVGMKINLNAVVVSEPEKREKDMRFVVESEGEKILVSTGLYQNIKYGDEVTVNGKLERPGIIGASDSGREFDYGAYLSKGDIYYTTSFAQVSIESHNNANPVLATLLRVKESFVAKMKDILAEPEASLLAGLLVSGKQALPSSILDEFKNAGVVHIVVLSGYNINVVAQFFAQIFSFLSLRLAGGASIVGIILFTLMTGATATVVRASIMALIAVSGKLFGRSYSAPRALLVAGFLMLIQNPKILIFDPSFQLSMLATLAMVYVSPTIERLLPRIASAKWGLGPILVSTISTQIFVLPYLLYSMGNISVIALISNILILAFVPFTMLVGFVSTILAYISTIIALPFTYITHLLLAWILGVANVLGNLSFSSIKVASFPLWMMFSVYLIYAAFFRFLDKKS